MDLRNAVLAGSLDIATLSERLTTLLVPTLGDWCSIDVLQDDGQIQRLAVAHADPARAGLAAQLRQQYPWLEATAAHTLTRVLRTGQSWFDPTPSPARLYATARDTAHWELLQALGFKAELVVPLQARGHVLGTITCVLSDGSRRYGPADLALAEDIAQRAALALDNARLYQEAHTARLALQQTNATLEQRVAERTAALADAMAAQRYLERAAQRAEHFALLGRLAAGVSHELRNPLGAVRLNVDLLAEELHDLLPDDVASITESLTEIETHLTRVEDLIQDYLSLARVHTMQLQVYDLGAVLQDWGAAFQRAATARGVTFQLDNTAALGAVALHANTLHRALLNLVDNALDAMPQGGTLTLAGASAPDGVRIEVRDTGIGIPAAQLQQIFEPLHTTKPGGTGLGLYIAQEIVAAHGGQLMVASTEGVGTTFTLMLPHAHPPCG